MLRKVFVLKGLGQRILAWKNKKKTLDLIVRKERTGGKVFEGTFQLIDNKFRLNFEFVSE